MKPNKIITGRLGTRSKSASANETSRKRNGNSAKKMNQREAAILRKVSARAVSTWRPVPEATMASLISILEDSLSRFDGSQNETVNASLDRIRTSVEKNLRMLKAPKEKWVNEKSLKFAQESLLSEQRRLKDLETTLTATLEKELREVEQLRKEAERLRNLTGSSPVRLHPLLQSLQMS